MVRPLMRRSRAALVPAKILPKPESQRVRKLNGCMVKSLHICTIERNRREAPGVRRFTVAVRVAADRREKRSFRRRVQRYGGQTSTAVQTLSRASCVDESGPKTGPVRFLTLYYAYLRFPIGGAGNARLAAGMAILLGNGIFALIGLVGLAGFHSLLQCVDFGAKSKKNSVYSVFIGLYWSGEKRMDGGKAPTRKFQTPEKLQAPNFNRRYFDGWVWLTSARVSSHWLALARIWGGRFAFARRCSPFWEKFGFFDNLIWMLVSRPW